jgi:hypothetical protein
MKDCRIEPTKKRFSKYMMLSLPAILSFVMLYLQDSINVIFVG